jgi:alkylhydroperoxidase/carboxymuconolactone decarboxylase family protein YurZ
MAADVQPPSSALDKIGTSDVLGGHLGPFFQAWLDTFIFHGRLDRKLRELAILRVMWRCGQAFEWGNHYRLARNAGVTREEVLAIRTAAPERDLLGPVAAVVRAADEVVDGLRVTPTTMSALQNVFPDPGLLDEFLYLLGGYRMFATVSASKDQERGGSHRRWPPDGVGPTSR